MPIVETDINGNEQIFKRTRLPLNMISLQSKSRVKTIRKGEEEEKKNFLNKTTTERMIFVIINGKGLIAYLQPQSVYICRLVCLGLFSIAMTVSPFQCSSFQT